MRIRTHESHNRECSDSVTNGSSGIFITLLVGHGGHMKLKANYYVNGSCDDCGEDIEECYYTNDKDQICHVTTCTNGHYYHDGSARCEGCHEGSR